MDQRRSTSSRIHNEIVSKMVIMGTKKCLCLLRDAVALSAVLVVFPAVCLAPQGDRFQISPAALQPVRINDVAAQLPPQPPCGKEPIPSYPGLDESADVKSWSESELGRDWRPPGCTGWSATGFTTLVTTVARFRHTSGSEGLLSHIGAISETAGTRYWSTTHKRWQTLIVDAYALTGLQSGRRRQDFTPDEMKEGNLLYFEQVDNLSGKATYRMHIVEASPDRLVFEVENVSTMRYLFVPILHPSEMQLIYFLDRESDDVWRYYSIVRTGKYANRMIAGNGSSSVNRAVAFYRHMVGIPTDREPPEAR